MSACLEMCLDSECISLNPLALLKAFCLNIHADYLEKLGFFTAIFLQSSSYLEGCVCVFCYFHLSLQMVKKKVF